MPAHKPLILSPVNTLLQASTVGAMLVLIWVSSSGWTTMQAKMQGLEAAQAANSAAMSELAKSTQALATVTAEVQKQLGDVLRDRWTGTDMSFLWLRFKSANVASGLVFPEVERVFPPVIAGAALIPESPK